MRTLSSVNEEQELESDEERPARSQDTGRDTAGAGAGSQEVQSPGALADTTADLTLASPSPGPSHEGVTSSPGSSKPHSLVEAFRDSVLSLAAEATAHAATVDIKVEPEPKSEPQLGHRNEPKGEELQIKESIIHDSLRKSAAISESTSVPSTKTEQAPPKPAPVAQVETIRAEENLPAAETSSTEHPSTSRQAISPPDFASALGPTTIMPVTLPEPQITTTPAAFYHGDAEGMDGVLPVLKHDFGSALGPTNIRIPLEPEPAPSSSFTSAPAPAPVEVPTPSTIPEIPKENVVSFYPVVELEVDDDEESDGDAEEQMKEFLAKRRV
ncbi:hypothetical protein BCR34DRAFT_219872 [Clohesyomyces aquaticus]|uniref:Uncharacterized protein n=1 Tax=Clohesyomyces aquaticus TaxID=1231657 RepID=A0A1Y1Y9K0_9PLEO|nr:hypothetical protein BCR34DRAFT_219872 [Clohesyomyces aquaticus]